MERDSQHCDPDLKAIGIAGLALTLVGLIVERPDGSPFIAARFVRIHAAANSLRWLLRRQTESLDEPVGGS